MLKIALIILGNYGKDVEIDYANRINCIISEMKENFTINIILQCAYLHTKECNHRAEVYRIIHPPATTPLVPPPGASTLAPPTV